jgi:hypothetical protein
MLASTRGSDVNRATLLKQDFERYEQDLYHLLNEGDPADHETVEGIARRSAIVWRREDWTDIRNMSAALGTFFIDATTTFDELCQHVARKWLALLVQSRLGAIRRGDVVRVGTRTGKVISTRPGDIKIAFTTEEWIGAERAMKVESF